MVGGNGNRGDYMIDYTIRFENEVVGNREVLNVFARIIVDEEEDNASIQLQEYSKGKLDNIYHIPAIIKDVSKKYPNLNSHADVLALSHSMDDAAYELLNATEFFSFDVYGEDITAIELEFE